MAIDIEKLKQAMHKPASATSYIQQAKNKQQESESVPDFELDDDGEEYMPVGTAGILASTEKLLAMNRGLVEPDERDSLKFQKILRPHSMLRESIKMDAGKIARTAMYQAAKRKNLKGIQPGAFDAYVNRLLIGNPLTSPLEEINPMQLVANARRVTKMGPGGLGSDQSITEEAQNVHPSQFGFVSVIEGPECHDEETQVFTRQGWINFADATENTEFACKVDGVLEFHKPERIVHEPYAGLMYGVKHSDIDLLVTPGHRIVTKDSEALASDIYKQCIAIPGENGNEFITIAADDWYVQEYNGLVHCATVPGRVLLTRRNNKSGVWTGNSGRAGIDVRTAWGTKIGSNGRLYQKVYDKRRKKMRWMSPEDLDGLVIKMPD